jgi:hypothetical protein
MLLAFAMLLYLVSTAELRMLTDLAFVDEAANLMDVLLVAYQVRRPAEGTVAGLAC